MMTGACVRSPNTGMATGNTKYKVNGKNKIIIFSHELAIARAHTRKHIHARIFIHWFARDDSTVGPFSDLFFLPSILSSSSSVAPSTSLGHKLGRSLPSPVRHAHRMNACCIEREWSCRMRRRPRLAPGATNKHLTHAHVPVRYVPTPPRPRPPGKGVSVLVNCLSLARARACSLSLSLFLECRIKCLDCLPCFETRKEKRPGAARMKHQTDTGQNTALKHLSSSTILRYSPPLPPTCGSDCGCSGNPSLMVEQRRH
jgi:hypothetical protein